MRRLQRVAGPWDAAGANGAETKAAFRVGGAAAEAHEIRIDRQIAALILGMRVAPGRAGLPDLEQRIHHRRNGIVPDLPAEFDMRALRKMAGRAAVPNQHVMARRAKIGARAYVRVADEIGAAFPRQAEVEKRPRRLPWCLAGHASILHRRSVAAAQDEIEEV